MKTIKLQANSTDEREHVILSQLDHENIVKYYEHFEESVFRFKHLCILTEYCRVMIRIRSLFLCQS